MSESPEIVTEPRFKVGDEVEFIHLDGSNQGTFIVRKIQTMGWQSLMGSQGYKTNISLQLEPMGGGRHRDIWQCFCRIAVQPPLSSEAYEDAIAAVEIMEKIHEV